MAHLVSYETFEEKLLAEFVHDFWLQVPADMTSHKGAQEVEIGTWLKVDWLEKRWNGRRKCGMGRAGGRGIEGGGAGGGMGV